MKLVMLVCIGVTIGMLLMEMPANAQAPTTFTITAGSKSATITMLATPQVETLICIPLSLYAGQTTVCTATLDMPAPTGGWIVPLTITAPGVGPTTPVSVAGGATQVTFTVKNP